MTREHVCSEEGGDERAGEGAVCAVSFKCTRGCAGLPGRCSGVPFFRAVTWGVRYGLGQCTYHLCDRWQSWTGAHQSSVALCASPLGSVADLSAGFLQLCGQRQCGYERWLVLSPVHWCRKGTAGGVIIASPVSSPVNLSTEKKRTCRVGAKHSRDFPLGA